MATSRPPRRASGPQRGARRRRGPAAARPPRPAARLRRREPARAPAQRRRRGGRRARLQRDHDRRSITEAAKISRRTFYEYFNGKEELLPRRLRDDRRPRPRLDAGGGGAPAEPWPEQVRASLAALLDVLSRDLAVARFFLVEPLAAGGEIAARYRDAMQLLAETIRAASRRRPTPWTSKSATRS